MPEPIAATDPQPAAKANPFEAALREGAPSTYLAMVEAGLAGSFDPLPKDASGAGLCSLPLERNLGSLGAALAAKLIELGADPLAPHAAPPGLRGLRHFESSLPRDEALAPAPLASLAIASGFACYDGLWTALDPAGLKAVAATALPWACAMGRMAPIIALLAAGADPDQRDPQGWPAAARCQQAESLRLLLDAGADLRAALPPSRWRKEPRTAYEAILADSSNAAEPKAMRELAVEWSAAHAEKGREAGADLAEEAFKAIASSNADSARRCVEALGASAPGRRSPEGDTLLACACRHGQIPTARRLMAAGASPYEVTALDESPWALALRLANPASLDFGYARSRTKGEPTRGDRDRAKSLCEEIAAKRKFQPVPWTAAGPSGQTLMGTLLGRCPPTKFHALVEQAQAQGASMRGLLFAGMDLPCALLLHLASHSRWIGSDSYSGGRTASQALARAVLDRMPPQQSSLESKAALHQEFMRWATAGESVDARLGLDPVSRAHRLLVDALPNGPTESETLRALLLEGAKAAGARGLPATPAGLLKGVPMPLGYVDALAVEFEQGALAAASSSATATKAGPRL